MYYQDINLENSSSDSQILFLIGVGYEENKRWNYKSFKANSICREEEKRIVNEMIEFIESRKKHKRDKPRLFHWAHAEKTILTMLDKRYNNEFYDWINRVVWIDMCKIFTDEPIVLKGAMKFNLKEIANTMYRHGMITSKWQSEGPENGLAAMLNAIKYYRYFLNIKRDPKEKPRTEKIMELIINYNEVDCKSVYEIVKYLRARH